MAHIHELIDYATEVYIVFENNVLLIHHKKLNKWLPVGGHIELDENPEEGLLREIQEECGLEVEIYGNKLDFSSNDVKSLYPPTFLDIHKINDHHKHIGLVYFAKAKTSDIKHNVNEHSDIRWFTLKDLEDPKHKLQEDVKVYCKKAIELFK